VTSSLFVTLYPTFLCIGNPLFTSIAVEPAGRTVFCTALGMRWVRANMAGISLGCCWKGVNQNWREVANHLNLGFIWIEGMLQHEYLKQNTVQSELCYFCTVSDCRKVHQRSSSPWNGTWRSRRGSRSLVLLYVCSQRTHTTQHAPYKTGLNMIK
jgi:hypothetical protein